MIKKYIIACYILSFLITGCGVENDSHSSKEIEVNSMIQELMSNPGTRDMKEWLLRDIDIPICLGELDEEESVALIESGYAAGVVRMWAVEIDVDEDYENTGKILIQLPKDSDARRDVILWAKKAISGTGYSFDDDGADIAFLMLD